jgi:hypothetical protein
MTIPLWHFYSGLWPMYAGLAFLIAFAVYEYWKGVR